ncbi:hypothetical protein WA588_003580, partial [Blastocystis sp. NMH]
MEKTNPGIQKRVDPNSISLRRYQKKRQQKFNRNSNIISKYRHQKEKLYKEAGIVREDENKVEDESLLNDTTPVETKEPKTKKKEKSHKPDPFFHSRQLAEEHKKLMEEKEKEREKREQDLK